MSQQLTDQAGRFPKGRGATIIPGDLSAGERLNLVTEQDRRLTRLLAVRINALLADENRGQLLFCDRSAYSQLLATLAPQAEPKFARSRIGSLENRREGVGWAFCQGSLLNQPAETIALGDIVIDDDDILGDGVNIAARLEAMAEPGGIYITASVFEQVVGKLDLVFDDLGELQVKNIQRPVRVYRVRLEIAPSAAQGLFRGVAVAARPSIAVLPFQDMSAEKDQEYFADGVAEDIITGLSRSHAFFVIARNSSFTYKGRSVDVKQVAGELGVRYVLEGSVRKRGVRMRITAQLIDATTGNHVWAERYDREVDDIFVVQDEITANIVGVVAPEVIGAEMRRARRKDPASMNALGLRDARQLACLAAYRGG